MKETISVKTERNSVVVRETCPERMVKEGFSGVMIFKLRAQGGVSQVKGREKRVPAQVKRP